MHFLIPPEEMAKVTEMAMLKGLYRKEHGKSESLCVCTSRVWMGNGKS